MDYIQQAITNVQAKYNCTPRSNEPVRQRLARTLAERNAILPTPTPEQTEAHKAQLIINQGSTPLNRRRRVYL